MVIAGIAWEQLTDEKKDSVTALLKDHPAYETSWKEKFEKEGNGVVLGKYLMMRAARWPDNIKRSGNPQFDLRHNSWHFIGYEIHFDGTDSTNIEPSEKGDVVNAIEESRKMIADLTQTRETRAIYLSWLIHLVGDIHQPLHCASLFNNDFPKGDRGGNRLYIKPRTAGVKLHAMWDGALGSSSKFRPASNQGITMMEAHPKDSIADLSNNNAKDWSMVSFELAKKVAHMNGELKYGVKKNEAVELPEGYTAKMKKLCCIQGLTAGYRLGADVEGLFTTL
jgi:hypothetical protein